MVHLHLACNDDRGAFAGELHQVQLHSKQGDLLLELDFDPLGPGLPFAWPEEGLRFESELHVRLFPVRERASWVGNLYWEATWMTEAEAQDLASYLIARGFTVTEHICEAPWDAIAASEVE